MPRQTIQSEQGQLALGERLRQARLTRGLTQAGVAYLLGIGTDTLLRYEKGHLIPSPKVAARIRAWLDNPQVSFPRLRNGPPPQP